MLCPASCRYRTKRTSTRYEALGLDRVMATTFVWAEEVIAANLDMLFPGIEVEASYAFRVTRDADLEIKDDEASDLLTDDRGAG